jgi:putative acetyltransferase
MPVEIRPYRLEDAGVTANLFHETVRHAADLGYSAEQRAAWAPRVPEKGPWHARLSNAITLVAEDNSGITGFMSLEPSGYLDLAFVRTDRLGRGIAKALYETIVRQARGAKVKRLTTDASHMGCRFFERQGWRLMQEQTQVRHGVELSNFRMSLDLD